MYSHDNDADEPEWVKTEREQFVEFRDKNRDGKMDREETKDWILPSDYDHAEAEARHLVYESDQNKVTTVGRGGALFSGAHVGRYKTSINTDILFLKYIVLDYRVT